MEWKIARRLLASISAMVVTSTSLGLQNIPDTVHATSNQLDAHNHQQISAHDHEHDHEHIKVALLDSGVTDYQTDKSISFVDDDTVDNSHGNEMMSILMSNTEHIDVYDVRVLDDNGNGTVKDITNGIRWAVDNDADIILTSFAGNENSVLYGPALLYAENNNVIVISAAGNYASDAPCFPSAFPTVISVGAKVDDCCFWEYSNYGEYVNTFEISEYGTSGAAAVFAGKTASKLSENQALTPDDVRSSLNTTKTFIDYADEVKEDSLVVASACAHSFNGSYTTKDATCTTDGYRKALCTKCGAVLSSTTYPATGHNYKDYSLIQQATCESNGAMMQKCSKCTSKRTVSIPATGHAFNGSYTTTRQPTCTQPGLKEGKCSKCNKVVSSASIPVVAHDYKTHSIVKQATCETDGAKLEKCSKCGGGRTVTIPKTGHSFSGSYSTKNPTCTVDGAQEGKCSNCGKVLSSTPIPATGHTYKDHSIIQKETCETDGAKLVMCSVCGDKKTVTIPKTGHAFNGSYSTKEPTCTVDGAKEAKCIHCGKVLSSTPIPATGHTYKDHSIIQKETCETDGAKLVMCSVCGDKKTVTIPAPGHAFNGSFTTKEPTCTEEGAKEGKCINCGEVLTSTPIPAPGHDYKTHTIIQEATCEADGAKLVMCSRCGDKTTVTIPAPGHAFNGSFTTKEPTCTEEGAKEGKCINCGEVLTSTPIPAPGHTYKDHTIIQEATCEADGAKLVMCSVCGDKTTVKIPKKNHAFNGSYRTLREATCARPGVKVGECINCGDVLSEITIPQTEHSYGKPIVYVQPTCTTNGFSIEKCENCSNVKPNRLISPGHKFNGDYVTTIEPTCTDEGEKVGKCITCKSVVSRVPIPALGGDHSFNGSYNTTVEPTCFSEGKKEGKCNKCGKVVSTISIPTTEHDYGVWTIVYEETCTRPGLKYRICKVKDCQHRDYQTINPDGHSFNGSFETTKEPTCTEPGLKEGKCLKCGDTVCKFELPERGGQHVFNGSFEVIEPTCTEDGVRIGRCTRCGDIVSETKIPELDGEHQFNGSFEIIEPTCSKEGARIGKCIKCGVVVSESKIPMIPHDWGEWEVIEEPSEDNVGRIKRICKVCGEEEEAETTETAELTVEDCGYDSFYFRVNGDLDGGYSWPLYATETDENTGEVIGKSYLRLRFTTNVDWTITASSNIHVVDFNGNPYYSGSAGENCILVYMDEIPLYKEVNDIIGPFNLTITANEKSASYPIYQVSQRFYNGYTKDLFIEEMQPYIDTLENVPYEEYQADINKVLDVLYGKKLTGDEFIVCKTTDFDYFAVRSYISAPNEVTIKYIKYYVNINIETNNSSAVLKVTDSNGPVLSQGAAPLYSTNGTICDSQVDSFDEVYEAEVATGETILWGVSTGASCALSFLEATPLVGFFIGLTVDTTIDVVGHLIISANTHDNGGSGIETETSFYLNENCVLKYDKENNSDITITCDNNDYSTTKVSLNFNITDGQVSTPKTVNKMDSK